MANPNTPILNNLDNIGFDTSFTRGLLRQPTQDYAFYPDPILRQAIPPNYVDIASPTPRPQRPTQMDNTSTPYRDMGHVEPFNQTKVVDIATPMPRPTMEERQRAAGILAQPQNRRDNAMLATPKRPDMSIGTADALMSIGGAGLRGASEGGLASLGGMFQQKDAIDEVNRSAALEAYNAQIEQQEAERKARFEQQKQADLQAYREATLKARQGTTSSTSAKQDAERQQGIANYDQAITKMEMALGDLRSGMSLSGLIDGTIGALWDRVRGNPEATSRLLLQELKVDSALIQISQTKGAISNQEMKLFLSPTPDIKVDAESTWINWIERRLELAKTIRNRLANGETVDDPATEEQASQFATTPATTAQTSPASAQGDFVLSPEDQAIFDKYPQ